MERMSLGEHNRDWHLMLTVAHPNRRSKTHTHLQYFGGYDRVLATDGGKSNNALSLTA